jgi:Icc-related predicted phosphoesterase
LRIALTSDLHTLHREVEIPRADLFLMAGDACFMGNGPRQLDDFNDWLGELPVRHRLITAGNHDAPIAADVEMWRKRLSNATLLINEGIIIEGVHIWGSPVTRVDGAFGMPDEAERDALYSEIPSDPPVDILITHGPPLGILDGGKGCAALRRAVIRLRPRLHVFGHVHSAYGLRPTRQTLFVNAAVLDESGAPSNSPILLNFDSPA